MIIHKEQVDYIFPDGTPSKKLLVSYVNKEGKVSFLQYPIPPEQMFEWRYSSKAHADPNLFSQSPSCRFPAWHNPEYH